MSYRPQPGPSFNSNGSNQSPPLGVDGMGRVSPLPPVPQVVASNLGQPGSSFPPGHPQAPVGPQVPGQGVQGGDGVVGTGFRPSTSQTAVIGGPQDKGPDYVYFERRPAQFGDAITGKAMAAKMKLELYYKEAVEGVVGRKER